VGKDARVVRRGKTFDRAKVSAFLILIDLAALALTVLRVHGSARFVVGLAFGLLIPGWSIIGWLRLNNAALEFALTVGTSLGLLTVVAQILVTAHEWHLFALQVAVCVICLPLLIGQALGLRQSKN
jgi:uncharacterized membrane protein